MMLIPIMRIGDRAKKVYKINERRSFIGFKKLGKRGGESKYRAGELSQQLLTLSHKIATKNENEISPPHHSTEHAECKCKED